MWTRLGIAAALIAMVAGCASQGAGRLNGVSVGSPFGGGTLNSVDSGRQGSPANLYGW